jgi:hypothetical protein
MTARQWIDRFAAVLGVDPPTPEEWSALLRLAAEAAHGSERVAAPISCWLAGRAGRSPDEALEAAAAVTAEG